MCRKCQPCRTQWRQHWIGRLMAEHASSRATWFVTLTYGGGYDREDAYLLNRDHITEFRKRLRNDGHEFRLVTVGEFGGELGRAHWHGIIFWKTEPPKVPMNERFEWTAIDRRSQKPKPIWDHGWSQCELPKSSQAAMAYILKYLDKDKQGGRGDFSFPQRPAIGEEYLIDWARKKGEAGLSLFPKERPVYQVAGNTKDRGPTAGQLYDYWLDPKSCIYERMITAYIRAFVKKHPGRILPYDRLVHLWAEGASWQHRDAVPMDVGRMWLSVVEKCITLGLAPGSKLLFEDCGDSGVFVTDPARNVTEFRIYDDEGHVVWRQTVDGGNVGEREAARRKRRALETGHGLPRPSQLVVPPWHRPSEGSRRRRDTKPFQRTDSTKRSRWRAPLETGSLIDELDSKMRRNDRLAEDGKLQH